MYNGMIAPVKPLAIRGVIWYQGEANVISKTGPAYAGKMKALIGGWRQAWGYDFPFYFVQIAPWLGQYEPAQLPILWECQVASLRIPKTGMVVTTDLVDNITERPPEEQARGQPAGPLGTGQGVWQKGPGVLRAAYKSMKVEGNKIRLSFAHVGGGLKSRDGKPLSEFEIAAAGGKFVPAAATIDGDTVVVQAKGVATPAQVRFGWRNVANPNLMNKEGLPASPFQTDNWHGGTGE